MRPASSPSLSVRIQYADGSHLIGAAASWPSLPGSGVDWVEVTNDVGSIRVGGHSIYWLYRERKFWVIGGGSIGYTNPLGETLVPESGNHKYREIDYMPDLPHSSVKLGAWWPDKERPPHG